MDQDSIPNKAVPVPQTSPEEDATLLAIEALEAQSVDLDAPKTQQPIVAPAPLPPIVSKPAVTSKPITITRPEPTAIPSPAPVKTPTVALIAPQKPAPVIKPPVPKKPSTPAEAIAEALASDTPGPKRFQFFVNQKPPRMMFIVGGIIAILIGLGVAAYFTLF